MTRDDEPRRALVLSGGSVYAAYEVGIMKALFEGESPATGRRRIDPDVYAGTSAGSINAAVMTADIGEGARSTLGYLETVWLEKFGGGDSSECHEDAVRVRGDFIRYLHPRCLAADPLMPLYRLTEDTASFLQFGISRTAEFFSNPGAPLGRRLLEFINVAALISTEVLTRVIYESIDLKRLRSSSKTLQIATTNWRTGELRLFGNDEMSDEIGHDVVRASSQFPSLPPVFIEGDPYADGGYVLNTPLAPAIHAAADELHVVFMDPHISNIPLRRIDNTFDVFDKLYHITQATIFKRDIDAAKDINLGLKLLSSADGGSVLSADVARALLRATRLIRRDVGTHGVPRMLTIHLYHPRDDLGGILGLMNFDRGHISNLINKGYADAVTHDCQASGCILPD